MEINNELVAQWEPKIQKMSSNSYVVGLDKEDLAQELRIALVKAARAYDDSKGAIFHTYLHTSLVNTIRTLITKAQRKPIARSIDVTFDGNNTIPKEIAAAMVEPKNYTEEVEANIWIHAQGLLDKEKLFLELKLEGLTMEEITEDLGESAYKVRQSLRDKLHELKDANAKKDQT
jgi:RNA polymerase sigma factor (sigma-70 family)